MRVAAGIAATAGAPPAVTSSGSRGVLTRPVYQLALDDARGRRDLQQRVARVGVAAVRRELRAGDDAAPPPPLDVDEAAQRQAAAGRGRRDRERRAAEEAPAAAAQAPEAGVAAGADDPPGFARAVEELDADADPLRRVGPVRHRGPHADLAGRGGRVADVDRRPRRAPELRVGAGRAQDAGEDDPGERE